MAAASSGFSESLCERIRIENVKEARFSKLKHENSFLGDYFCYTLSSYFLPGILLI